MKIEKEMRFLDINEKDIEKKLKTSGAFCQLYKAHQCRYVYDFHPKDPNRWIRLRTNGVVSTLTIKKVTKHTINGTKEWEIEVSDFDETNKILRLLGYRPRAKQENIRSIYILDDVEISIDTWPRIPTYMELESDDIRKIEKVIKKLKLDNAIATTLDVATIYKDVYGIDIMKVKNLSFIGEEKYIARKNV